MPTPTARPKLLIRQLQARPRLILAIALGVLVHYGLTGLAILTGGDKWLEAQVLNLLPDSWVRITTLF